MAGPTVKEGAAMIHCMCKGLAKKRLVSLRLLEKDEEEDTDYKRVACEDEPCCLPITDSVSSDLICQAVDDCTS